MTLLNYLLFPQGSSVLSQFKMFCVFFIHFYIMFILSFTFEDSLRSVIQSLGLLTKMKGHFKLSNILEINVVSSIVFELVGR